MSVIRKIGRIFKELICSALGISTEDKQYDKRVFEPGKTPEPTTKQRIPKPKKPEPPCKKPPRELKKSKLKDNKLKLSLEGHEIDPLFIESNSGDGLLTDLNKDISKQDIIEYLEKDPTTHQVIKSLSKDGDSYISKEFVKHFSQDSEDVTLPYNIKNLTKVPRFQHFKIPDSNITYNLNYGTKLDPEFLVRFHNSRVISKTTLDYRVPWNYWFVSNKGLLVGFNMTDESHIKFRKKFSTYLRTKSKDDLISFLNKYKVDYWDMKVGTSVNNNLKKLTNPLFVLPGLDLDSSFVENITTKMYDVFTKHFDWNYKYDGNPEELKDLFEKSDFVRYESFDSERFTDYIKIFYQLNSLLLKILESILKNEPRADIYVPSEVKRCWYEKFGTNLDDILNNISDKNEMSDLIQKIKEVCDYEIEIDEGDFDKIVYSFEGPLNEAIDLYETLKYATVFNPIKNIMEPFLPSEYFSAYEETIRILKEFHRSHANESERVEHQRRMRENEILNLYHRVFPLFRYPDQDKIPKQHLNEKLNRNRKKE